MWFHCLRGCPAGSCIAHVTDRVERWPVCCASLLVRGPFAWLGHGWVGCSKNYPFPTELGLDYGEPVDKICKETAPNSGVFTREWTKASVQMDCATWTPTITMKE